MANRKICFVGNSHLACIKLAIEQEAEFVAQFSPEFFGGDDLLAGELALRGRAVTNEDADTGTADRGTTCVSDKPTIDVDSFDGFICVGLGCGYRPLFELALTHGTIEHARWADLTTLLSEAALRQTAHDIFATMPCVRLLQLIRSASSAPILLVAEPAPSETMLADFPWNVLERRRPTPYFGQLERLFRESVQTATNAFTTEVVFQPESTLAHPCFTQYGYKKRGVGFDGDASHGYGDDEYWHMNASYGAEMLQSLRRSLQKLVTSAHAEN